MKDAETVVVVLWRRAQVPEMSVQTVRAAYGGSVVLTEDIISVTDADTELHDLVFTLDRQPRHGNVTNRQRLITDAEHFTFNDLVNSTIR